MVCFLYCKEPSCRGRHQSAPADDQMGDCIQTRTDGRYNADMFAVFVDYRDSNLWTRRAVCASLAFGIMATPIFKIH